PQGIYTAIGGNAEDQGDTFKDMITLLLLIVVLVFIVMASQFESIKMPFIIITSALFAFTGVFLTLWMTGTNLSVIALIGAIMLVGIVVKNGIVLVDFTNILRARGYDLYHAVTEAGKSRLRPVLMTTLTTILGMIPLAVSPGEGSEMWRPMGIAIIGGLTFSTILTLVVVPVLYYLFDIRKEKKRIKIDKEMYEAIG
ncbi:MAG: efflux RND transporter permease subunit, partial [Bacteroidales bacterium]|nr:efflux RND transporter permease subunit [Bacteroidales bacterium]